MSGDPNSHVKRGEREQTEFQEVDDQQQGKGRKISDGKSEIINGDSLVDKQDVISDAACAVIQISRPSKYDSGWRFIIRNFTPSWFSVTMGTGIVAILLATIPFKHSVTYYLSVIFFILNTILFILASVISIMRYTIYPEIWGVMIRDPVNSLFLSTIPMGFATLINMWILICVPLWGDWAKTATVAFWIADTVASVLTTIALPTILMCRHDIKTLDRINAAQLLPIAATVVAAGIGAKTAAILDDPNMIQNIIFTCYTLWGISIPFAYMIFVLYYHRLVLHKLPSREVIVSAFLPLGPCGYSATILIILGKVARETFPKTGLLDPMAGQIAYVVGFLVGLIIWGFGLLWFCFALVSIYRSRPLPFNMGWWGFTFPLGVYSACTIQIGSELESSFFKVLGTIFATAVCLLWVIVATGTLKGALSGKMFYAPCLQNLKPKSADSQETIVNTAA